MAGSIRIACGEVPKTAEGVLPEELVLIEHQDRLFDFLDGGGEVVVPEERHFFAQRSAGLHHAAEPPRLAFQGVAAAFLLGFLKRLAAQLVGLGRRESANGLLEFPPLGDAPAHVFQRLLGTGPFGKREGIRRIDSGEQGIDRPDAPHGVEVLDFQRAAAESGAVQKVRGLERGPGIVGLRKHGTYNHSAAGKLQAKLSK